MKVLRVFGGCVLLLFGGFCLYVSCSGFAQADLIKAETGQLFLGYMILISLCFILGLTALFVGIEFLTDFFLTESVQNFFERRK